MNVKGILGDVIELPLEKGYALRRATQEKNLEIDKILTDLCGFPYEMGARYSWTNVASETQPGFTERMPPSEWRLHVISFSGTSGHVPLLRDAFNLVTPESEMGFTCTHRTVPDVGYGFKWGDAPMFQFIQRARWFTNDSLIEIDQEMIQEIVAIHTKLEGHNHDFLDLRSALIELAQLKSLPLAGRVSGITRLATSARSLRPNPLARPARRRC
jgi:hypothetical protein